MAREARMKYRVKGSNVYVRNQATTLSPSSPEADYEAGSTKGPRIITWRASGVGPNDALKYNLKTLRDRSHDAVRKNPYAAAAIDRICDNIVGTGIKPRSLIKDKVLRDEVQQLWLDWTDEADADGQFDFYGLQYAACRGMVTGGETFVRSRVRRIEDNLVVPYQLQVLEGDFVPVDKDEFNRDIRAGIEFDGIGRRRAYYMYRNHPGDSASFKGKSNEALPVPAADIDHVYLPLRPGQIRGEPWLTRILVKMRDLDSYDDAELMRKKTTTMLAGFLRKPAGEDNILGETATADEDGSAVVQWEPGMLQVLPEGWDVEFSKPVDVGGNYEAFMRQQQRGLATGMGILYEQLTGDYSQLNDRTLRAALNDFRRRIELLQHHVMVFKFCRPVWRRFMLLAELAGTIKRPAGMSDRDFLRAQWMPPSWPYIHPQQDIEARNAAIRAGLGSRQQAVDERGYDVEEIDRQIKEDNDRADALGLVFDSDPRKVSNAGLTQARPEGTKLPKTSVPEDTDEVDPDPEDGDDE